ncbi:MAG: HAMP domain-containing histidine kinase [Deltaproteobacteria bacterium]|nr:MAG: HAMP domain-containing histidine kinase [Deltaproteobacteria bacterium]
MNEPGSLRNSCAWVKSASCCATRIRCSMSGGRRITVLYRTGVFGSDLPAEESEVRGRLLFLERLTAAFEQLQGVERTAEIVAELGIRHLATACWIYLTDAQGVLRLEYALQSDASNGQPEIPADLLSQVAQLDSTKRETARPSESCSLLLPLKVGNNLLGAIALILHGPAGASATWMAELLASRAGGALARARAHAGVQRAVQIRDDAFAAAAHELGNSLGALRLQVHAILHAGLSQVPDSRLLSRLYAMERQVTRLIALNQRMLAPSRLTMADFQPKLEPVDASEVVREVLAREADQLAWRRCSVEFTAPGPVVGQWDKGLLDQIFSNLLSNAMKYGHGGPILIALRETSTKVQLEVRDHGTGIAADDQQRIFEKFERAATTERESSLGLGLWLTREMVRALGGTIRVHSAIGAGSTFEVELPRGAPVPPGEEEST